VVVVADGLRFTTAVSVAVEQDTSAVAAEHRDGAYVAVDRLTNN